MLISVWWLSLHRESWGRDRSVALDVSLFRYLSEIFLQYEEIEKSETNMAKS